MPTTKAVTKRYYPALSEMITVDDLPEFLHFAETGLNLLLDRIHYKNFQYSKSYRGDAAFYSLDIISKNIGFDLPFGLRFVLNPDEDGDAAISSFPISLEYQWEVLAFLRSFDLQNFAFTPEAFFQLGLQIFRISEEQVIAQTLNYFLDNQGSTEAKFQDLIDEINLVYEDADLVLPPGEEPTVELVAQLISENPNIPDNVSQVMFLTYILDHSSIADTRNNLEKFYALMVPDGIENYVKKLLKPKLRATLTLSAGIQFPPSILKPVSQTGDPTGEMSVFKFTEATFYVDTEAGIGAQVEFAGSLIPRLPVLHQIGNTGLTITIEQAKLDLSRTTNIPEADAAGYPVDFMGLYVKHAEIGFNRFGETAAGSGIISADNLFIGTGGISGTLSLESGANPLRRQFNKFEVELDIFSITFRLNSIVNSNIAGKLKLKKWKQGGQDAVIEIQAHFQDNGDFNITASTDQLIPPITLPGVLEIEIIAFSFGKENDRYYIEVSGMVNFIANIPGLGDVLPKGIEVKGLRIWDDGDLEFRGGALMIPKAFRLSVGPVKMEVTNMSTGTYRRPETGGERLYNFFGFDGMINTGTAGINATGNGIKFYYTNDEGAFRCFISIDKIAIDMVIPGPVVKETEQQKKDRENGAIIILDGYLTMKNPETPDSSAGLEYSGAVSFTMPRFDIAGSAGMRLNPAVPSFLVDIGLELSTALPLGATGLGIYGFRGLFGQHYLPDRSEDQSWWEYYNAPEKGINVGKFSDQPGYSVGAGVSIATSFDSGKVFSAKLFLYLGLPGLFILEGQAGILRSRLGLNDDVDPPFSAIIVLDSNSFRGTLGVDYRLPEGAGWIDGKIFTLSGTLDMAFFFNNASGWYLNVGKDQPESARVRAEILGLFRGYAYLMISSRGFKAGAGARFDFKRSVFGISVGIGASLDMGGYVSFRPVQIGAFMQVGGYAYFKIWKIGFSISVQISFAVEAPRPFIITGGVQLKAKVWFASVSFRFEITWRLNNENASLAPLPVLELSAAEDGKMPAIATNILTGETFQINYIESDNAGDIHNYRLNGWKYDFTNADAIKQVTIPLDSFIDIELLKPVRPTVTNIGGASNQLPDGYSELFPPQKALSDQINHSFEISGLDIYAWRESGGGSWQPYHIYEAVTAIVDSNTGSDQVDLSELKQGYWQFVEPNRYNKIRLLAQNMFSYKNEMNSSALDLDAMNYSRNDLFCFESILKETVVDWFGEPLGRVYPENVQGFVKAVSFVYDNLHAYVKGNSVPASHLLSVDANGGKMTVLFPQPVSTVNLNFGLNNSDINIEFVRNVAYTGIFGNAVSRDVVVSSLTLLKAQQNSRLTYNNLNVPIDKILLTFKKAGYLDFDGDLVIGGHFSLPDQYITSDNLAEHHEAEQSRALLFVTLFNHSFTAEQVLNEEYRTTTGKAGQWVMDRAEDSTGGNPGFISGSPDLVDGFYENDGNGVEQLHRVYSFSGNSDALFVPFAPALKVESGSFSFEATVILDPYFSGISTLLSKIAEDPVTGSRKGFALHLYQDTTGDTLGYANGAEVPSFGIWLTCYQDLASTGIKVTEKYSMDCSTSLLSERQYKHILVSVNRETGLLEIYIDRMLKHSGPIPGELGVFNPSLAETQLKSLTYLIESQQRRMEENLVTREALSTETTLLGNNLNKTVQPVWRPNTIFAVVVKTRDVVKTLGHDGINSNEERSAIFGFRTAGPIGHFQQESSVYRALEEQDRGAEFKLASLKSYIDYERSFPDVQSRYDLSKPVFYHLPEIRLFFTKPYVNAMYYKWDEYQGLPAVESKLEIQVLDPFGNSSSPELIWANQDTPVTMENYQILPPDQQVLFLMNAAASGEDGCGENPITFTKRTKRGVYQIGELLPDRLYTAQFNAQYTTPEHGLQRSEVHKFSFKTSRFTSFEQQVRSYIYTGLPENGHDAIYPLVVAFTNAEIEQTLKVLIDDNIENDPAAVVRYAVKYDRLVYGGLGLKNPEPIVTTVFYTLINVDPDTSDKRILGLLIRNPEPFNDPKLPESLRSDTVQCTLTTANNTVLAPDGFIYIHARDTSGVFITNAAMDVPEGEASIQFRYKLFNGADYDLVSPDACLIQLTKDF